MNRVIVRLVLLSMIFSVANTDTTISSENVNRYLREPTLIDDWTQNTAPGAEVDGGRKGTASPDNSTSLPAWAILVIVVLSLTAVIIVAILVGIVIAKIGSRRRHSRGHQLKDGQGERPDKVGRSKESTEQPTIDDTPTSLHDTIRATVRPETKPKAATRPKYQYDPKLSVVMPLKTEPADPKRMDDQSERGRGTASHHYKTAPKKNAGSGSHGFMNLSASSVIRRTESSDHTELM